MKSSRKQKIRHDEINNMIETIIHVEGINRFEIVLHHLFKKKSGTIYTSPFNLAFATFKLFSILLLLGFNLNPLS